MRFNFIELNSEGMPENRMEIVASNENYCRITVPPSIIFGFKGMSDGESIVVNVADIEHKDEEVKRIDSRVFEFK